MEFMLGLVYVATAATYIGVGVMVYGWVKHGRKEHSVR
ncbi:hypothetical protein SAMN00017405_0653 [Desulfonispora thiosulfatigenes DSM 11270]|uniref:Uncharacterized protein n=1 Tax=Desulfonispora thiosulfatigenes DSM 11270 TaxID=656914 RepID=A0A1W1V8Z7_DESTI|nr:hypothetical protein SAMN00017405_0653 [Desulfonispora thiosulfatigenes DSM 11270]